MIRRGGRTRLPLGARQGLLGRFLTKGNVEFAIGQYGPFDS